MVGYSPVVATTADVIGSFIVTILALGLWGGVPKLDESPWRVAEGGAPYRQPKSWLATTGPWTSQVDTAGRIPSPMQLKKGRAQRAPFNDLTGKVFPTVSCFWGLWKKRVKGTLKEIESNGLWRKNEAVDSGWAMKRGLWKELCGMDSDERAVEWTLKEYSKVGT